MPDQTSPPDTRLPDRAVLFIDGNNWYHSLKECGVSQNLAYKRISEKLVGPRRWIETRYYVGKLAVDAPFYSQQRQFTENLRGEDSRITVHFGRIEGREQRNPLADPLLHLVGAWENPDRQFRTELVKLIDKHRWISQFKEKAVDVMIAVDMSVMAFNDQYDAAYLLSADGDFTPVVEFVKRIGKKVYAASPAQCAALAQMTTYIRLRPDWFDDCLI